MDGSTETIQSIDAVSAERLTGFFAHLITYVQKEVASMRASFLNDLNDLDPVTRQKRLGHYSEEDCWKAYADDHFIRIVHDLEAMTGEQF